MGVGVHSWELPPRTSGQVPPELEAPGPLCSEPKGGRGLTSNS